MTCANRAGFSPAVRPRSGPDRSNLVRAIVAIVDVLREALELRHAMDSTLNSE